MAAPSPIQTPLETLCDAPLRGNSCLSATHRPRLRQPMTYGNRRYTLRRQAPLRGNSCLSASHKPRLRQPMTYGNRRYTLRRQAPLRGNCWIPSFITLFLLPSHTSITNKLAPRFYDVARFPEGFSLAAAIHVSSRGGIGTDIV